MDFIVLVLILFLIILLLPFLGLTSRGEQGEKIAKGDISRALDSSVYQSVHNIIIPSKNGTAQIDHLLVSPFGVFIVETKNIKGWIFGSEKQTKWTQSLYGNNYSFQNPVRQTFRQKRVLSEYLNLSEALVHTVIYFVGDCTFKTYLPPNVINHGLGSYIKRYQYPVLSEREINRIIEQLEELLSDSSLTEKSHIESLRERHNSDTVCPRCGSDLVERMVKNGSRAGSRFLGCSSYPRCRFTKKLS